MSTERMIEGLKARLDLPGALGVSVRIQRSNRKSEHRYRVGSAKWMATLEEALLDLAERNRVVGAHGGDALMVSVRLERRRLEARISELEKALRPFTKIVEAHAKAWGKAAECEAARAVLHGRGEEGQKEAT